MRAAGVIDVRVAGRDRDLVEFPGAVGQTVGNRLHGCLEERHDRIAGGKAAARPDETLGGHFGRLL